MDGMEGREGWGCQKKKGFVWQPHSSGGEERAQCESFATIMFATYDVGSTPWQKRAQYRCYVSDERRRFAQTISLPGPCLLAFEPGRALHPFPRQPPHFWFFALTGEEATPNPPHDDTKARARPGRWHSRSSRGSAFRQPRMPPVDEAALEVARLLQLLHRGGRGDSGRTTAAASPLP